MAQGSARTYSPGILPIKIEDGRILLVDQRKLPYEFVYFDATSHEDMCFSIKDMVVRGAPSIGVAAAYGLAFEMKRLAASCQAADVQQMLVRFRQAKNELNETRPTAVNLRWALEIIDDTVTAAVSDGINLGEIANLAQARADEIHDQHLAANFAISEYGAALVPHDSRIVTHCNAGSLATCGFGTALGVIRSAYFSGKNVAVFVDETRPRNQGAKLTMWELAQDGVPSTLICDSMSGSLMAHGKIDMVVTGADRIARNGDSANKIGTYNLAVLAHYHKIPFYIAAPLSTFDAELSDGRDIPIEERCHSEITCFEGRSATIDNANAYNPAFDVTPAELIAGIITEQGVLRPDYRTSIARALDLELLAT